MKRMNKKPSAFERVLEKLLLLLFMLCYFPLWLVVFLLRFPFEWLGKMADVLEEMERAIGRGLSAFSDGIAALKKQNDTHVQAVNFALNALGRYLTDIQDELNAMEAEEPGSGVKLRAKCEAALGRLLSQIGWQV